MRFLGTYKGLCVGRPILVSLQRSKKTMIEVGCGFMSGDALRKLHTI